MLWHRLVHLLEDVYDDSVIVYPMSTSSVPKHINVDSGFLYREVLQELEDWAPSAMSGGEAYGPEGQEAYREILKLPWRTLLDERQLPKRFHGSASTNGFEISLHVGDPILNYPTARSTDSNLPDVLDILEETNLTTSAPPPPPEPTPTPQEDLIDIFATPKHNETLLVVDVNIDSMLVRVAYGSDIWGGDPGINPLEVLRSVLNDRKRSDNWEGPSDQQIKGSPGSRRDIEHHLKRGIEMLQRKPCYQSPEVRSPLVADIPLPDLQAAMSYVHDITQDDLLELSTLDDSSNNMTQVELERHLQEPGKLMTTLMSCADELTATLQKTPYIRHRGSLIRQEQSMREKREQQKTEDASRFESDLMSRASRGGVSHVAIVRYLDILKNGEDILTREYHKEIYLKQRFHRYQNDQRYVYLVVDELHALTQI